VLKFCYKIDIIILRLKASVFFHEKLEASFGLVTSGVAVLGAAPFAFRSRRLSTPCRRGQRSSPERETSGFRNSRTTARRSSSDTNSVFRRATVTASCAGVRVVCNRCAVWLRSCTLSRLRHFQTVCSEIPYRSATIHAGSSLAWIAVRIFGGVVSPLVVAIRTAPHRSETRLCISLPFLDSFIANIARKRSELNSDKTSFL
jgi:hypothetical protein